jgi:signal transduction histidine kinase
MFRTWPLSKRFAMLSGPLLIVAALLMAAFNHVWFVEGIERAAERNNVALAHVLSNVVWPEFESEILGRTDFGGVPASAGDWRANLTREIASLVRHTSVAKVKVYLANGTTAYSTDPTEMDEHEGDNEGFQAAIKGEVESEIEFEDEINTFDMVINDRNTVSSYIPIFDADNPKRVVAVFEIYDDITALLAQLRDAEIRTTLFVGSLFLLVYACLVTMVVRSERMAKRHHEEGLRLADAAARADAASTAKSEFLANMSHELRTPLNAILGFSEVMKEGLLGPVTPRPYAEYVRHIWVAASHLTDIIGNILDLSKIDAGKVTVEKSRVALPETILLVCSMMHDKASKRGIALKQEIDSGLDTIVTDAVKLRQILLNLLSNAIKFTADGGEVMLRIARAGDTVEFSIRDTGIGMDDAEIKIAMSPFGQIESPFSRMHEGTGLGLPLTQRLVGLIGGRMEISSRKGVGTLVKVTLPADEPALVPDVRPMPEPPVAKARAQAE